MSVGDHAVGFVQDEDVDHGKLVEQVVVELLRHHFPEAARRRNDYRRLVLQQPGLLFDAHSSHDRTDFDLLLILRWNHRSQVVFDLDGQLTSRRDNQTCDAVHLHVWVLL